VEHAGSVTLDTFFSALSILNRRSQKAKWISPFNVVKCENRVIKALATCRETVEEAFHVLDKDRNGWISKKEWKDRMPQLGIRRGSFSERELTQAWKSLDQNGDGRVNWIEWVNAFRILEGGVVPGNSSNSPFAAMQRSPGSRSASRASTSPSPADRTSESPAGSPAKPSAKSPVKKTPIKEIHEMSRGELENECVQHRTTMKQSAKRMDAARKMVAELKEENARLKGIMQYAENQNQ
jgi:hypothetical protein